MKVHLTCKIIEIKKAYDILYYNYYKIKYIKQNK